MWNFEELDTQKHRRTHAAHKTALLTFFTAIFLTAKFVSTPTAVLKLRMHMEMFLKSSSSFAEALSPAINLDTLERVPRFLLNQSLAWTEKAWTYPRRTFMDSSIVAATSKRGAKRRVRLRG